MGESRRRTLEDCTGPRDRGPKWRAPLRRPVRLHHLLSQDFFEAVTENISEGGMLVQSTMTLPIGAGVSFRITLSDGDALIQGFGRVIWLNHDEDGASNGMAICAASARASLVLQAYEAIDRRLVVAEQRVERCIHLRDACATDVRLLDTHRRHWRWRSGA